MDVQEAVSLIDRCSSFAIAVPMDLSDPVRISALSGLQSLGWKVVHVQSMAVLSYTLSTPSLDGEYDSKVLFVVPWPTDSVAFKAAQTCLPLIKGSSLAVAFESDPFPPRKNKESSSLLSVTVVPEDNHGSYSQQWVTTCLGQNGFKVSQRVSAQIWARINGCPEAMPRVLKVLKMVSPADVSEAVVQESVPFYPESDGSAVMDDLLHLRSVALCRRLQYLPSDQVLPLFRLAAKEFLLVHQVCLALKDADKSPLNPQKVAESMAIDEKRVTTRYLPLAKELGEERVRKVIDVLSKADLLLLRSPFETRKVSMALAVSVCKA